MRNVRQVDQIPVKILFSSELNECAQIGHMCAQTGHMWAHYYATGELTRMNLSPWTVQGVFLQ